jgi:DHA1 family bicyclomycin/chloramphenicol resistance-like MFS transporter
MIFGMALFVLSSLAILAVPSIGGFILLRFVQAVGACSGVVIGWAVVRDLFEGPQVTRAMATLSTIQSAGPILAPVVGGFMFAAFGWKANFLFLSALGALGFSAVFFGLRETLPEHQRRSAHPWAVLTTYGGLLLNADYLLLALCSASVLGAVFTYVSASPFVFLEVFKLTPRQYGLLFGAVALAVVASAQLNRRLVRRFHPKRVLIGAVLVNLTAGTALVACAAAHAFPLLIAPLWVFISTIPIIMSNSNGQAMAATHGRAGSAASLLGSMQWTVAGCASMLSGLVHGASALPMTLLMLMFSGAAATSLGASVLRGRAAAAGDGAP